MPKIIAVRTANPDSEQTFAPSQKTKLGVLNAPNLLSCFRFSLVPFLIFSAHNHEPKWFLAGFLGSLLSDFADGFLARRLNQTSELGAKLDSWADLATYLALPLCAWWLWPDLIRREAPYALAAVASYILAVVFGFLKFGRLTSYHTWGAKLSVVSIGPTLLLLFAGGLAWPFRVATFILVLAELEEMAITATLSEWRANIPTFRHAMKFKRIAR